MRGRWDKNYLCYILSVGSYVWAVLVFSPLVYSINCSTLFKMSKKDIGDKYPALPGHWGKRVRNPTLAPGCWHPPVNWSRPSTKWGRRLSFMRVRHIFFIRFRSFGRRHRSSPSERKGAPWPCSGTVAYKTEHRSIFSPRATVTKLACTGARFKCCTPLHTSSSSNSTFFSHHLWSLTKIDVASPKLK